jgi:hypothetical protein
MSGGFGLPLLLLGALLCAFGLAGCAPEQANSGYAASGTAKPATSAVRISRAQIPLPAQALLAPEPEPSCDSMAASYDGGSHATQQPDATSAQLASLGATQSSDGQVLADVPSPQIGAVAKPGTVLAEADANLILLTRLSLELQCYRQAERTVRKRLHDLQASVGETIKAMKRQGSGAL